MSESIHCPLVNLPHWIHPLNLLQLVSVWHWACAKHVMIDTARGQQALREGVDVVTLTLELIEESGL